MLQRDLLKNIRIPTFAKFSFATILLYLISFLNLSLKHKKKSFAAHSKIDAGVDASKEIKIYDNKSFFLNFKTQRKTKRFGLQRVPLKKESAKERAP